MSKKQRENKGKEIPEQESLRPAVLNCTSLLFWWKLVNDQGHLQKHWYTGNNQATSGRRTTLDKEHTDTSTRVHNDYFNFSRNYNLKIKINSIVQDSQKWEPHKPTGDVDLECNPGQHSRRRPEKHICCSRAPYKWCSAPDSRIQWCRLGSRNPYRCPARPGPKHRRTCPSSSHCARKLVQCAAFPCHAPLWDSWWIVRICHAWSAYHWRWLCTLQHPQPVNIEINFILLDKKQQLHVVKFVKNIYIYTAQHWNTYMHWDDLAWCVHHRETSTDKLVP